MYFFLVYVFEAHGLYDMRAHVYSTCIYHVWTCTNFVCSPLIVLTRLVWFWESTVIIFQTPCDSLLCNEDDIFPCIRTETLYVCYWDELMLQGLAIVQTLSLWHLGKINVGIWSKHIGTGMGFSPKYFGYPQAVLKQCFILVFIFIAIVSDEQANA